MPPKEPLNNTQREIQAKQRVETRGRKNLDLTVTEDEEYVMNAKREILQILKSTKNRQVFKTRVNGLNLDKTKIKQSTIQDYLKTITGEEFKALRAADGYRIEPSRIVTVEVPSHTPNQPLEQFKGKGQRLGKEDNFKERLRNVIEKYEINIKKLDEEIKKGKYSGKELNKAKERLDLLYKKRQELSTANLHYGGDEKKMPTRATSAIRKSKILVDMNDLYLKREKTPMNTPEYDELNNKIYNKRVEYYSIDTSIKKTYIDNLNDEIKQLDDDLTKASGEFENLSDEEKKIQMEHMLSLERNKQERMNKIMNAEYELKNADQKIADDEYVEPLGEKPEPAVTRGGGDPDRAYPVETVNVKKDELDEKHIESNLNADKETEQKVRVKPATQKDDNPELGGGNGDPLNDQDVNDYASIVEENEGNMPESLEDFFGLQPSPSAQAPVNPSNINLDDVPVGQGTPANLALNDANFQEIQPQVEGEEEKDPLLAQQFDDESNLGAEMKIPEDVMRIRNRRRARRTGDSTIISRLRQSNKPYRTSTGNLRKRQPEEGQIKLNDRRRYDQVALVRESNLNHLRSISELLPSL